VVELAGGGGAVGGAGGEEEGRGEAGSPRGEGTVPPRGAAEEGTPA